jgi:hypothetical protein
MPLDFCIWGFEKDKVYVPPVPLNVQQLKERIRTAHALMDEEFLAKVWQEVEFRWDVCCMTGGSHIGNL